MKQLFASLIVVVTAVFSGTGVANAIDLDIKSLTTDEIRSAAPSQTPPGAEPEEDPETELTLFGQPDLENRPER